MSQKNTKDRAGKPISAKKVGFAACPNLGGSLLNPAAQPIGLKRMPKDGGESSVSQQSMVIQDRSKVPPRSFRIFSGSGCAVSTIQYRSRWESGKDIRKLSARLGKSSSDQESRKSGSIL